MPELPEVETTVKELNEELKGRKITNYWYDWPKLNPVSKVKGKVIQELRRRGKNILMYFKDKTTLLIHLKMTGHLLVGKWRIKGKTVEPLSPEELKEKVNDYIHFILTLDNGKMLGFSDLRKFGKVVFGRREEIDNLVELKKLGPDALLISLDDFKRRVRTKKKTIYQVLMDQTVLAGIGNIYANDILFKAKVHPFKEADKLSDKELSDIHKAIKFILTKAIKARGTSIADYRDIKGRKGGYGKMRLVYQREGEKCPRKCGGSIKRQKKGGRSAFFCSHCQKLRS